MKNYSMLIRTAVAFISIAAASTLTGSELREPAWDDLPQWKGFNLLDKFYLNTEGRDGPYEERDFVFMAYFGFNFARLPIDYRTYMRDDDPDRFDEIAFEDIDQAIEWGREYGIHISLNLHRIPGFTVADPPEEPSLFEDDATLERAAEHWGFIAKRYENIPSKYLSFNLFNEPTDVSGEAYYKVAKRLCEAIREHSPDRLIICDGLGYGRIPVPELVSLKVAQATRGYEPIELTHYNATWVGGSHRYPLPTWPLQPVLNGNLYGPLYPDLRNDIRIQGPFPDFSTIILGIESADSTVNLVVETDQGEVILSTEIQPLYEHSEPAAVRYYQATVPSGTDSLTLFLEEGTRLVFDSIGIGTHSDSRISRVVPSDTQWDTFSSALHFQPSNEPGEQLVVGTVKGKEWFEARFLSQWQKFREETGTGVIFGEFGVFNQTPHDVATRFVGDIVELCEQAGFGWSLWELEGDFGIISSRRTDVDYQTMEIEGYRYEVDRKMLNMLLKASGLKSEDEVKKN